MLREALIFYIKNCNCRYAGTIWRETNVYRYLFECLSKIADDKERLEEFDQLAKLEFDQLAKYKYDSTNLTNLEVAELMLELVD